MQVCAKRAKTSAAARTVKLSPLTHRYGVDVTTSPDHTARPASSALLGALDVAGASALARYRAELLAGRRARLTCRAVKALGAGVLVGLLFPLWIAAAAAVIVALGDLGHH